MSSINSDFYFAPSTSRLVEDHDKTLERVAERWKQNWPMEWDDVSQVLLLLSSLLLACLLQPNSCKY